MVSNLKQAEVSQLNKWIKWLEAKRVECYKKDIFNPLDHEKYSQAKKYLEGVKNEEVL